MADSDCISETASSACDEERIRRLFQACDTNGDGFIDSNDLFSICKELNLEDSIGELMQQLGADAQGRISYEQFLRSRLALRPEIDALKHSKHDVASDNSQGKLDQWEWDSGARDMSPIPKSLVQKVGMYTEEDLKIQIEKSTVEQAQRYEERLTELHSVIAELTKKLHQQRAMAIAEEDEASEVCTSAFDDSATCALEVSEMDPPENGNGSDSDNKIPEISVEQPSSKLSPTSDKNSETFTNIVDSLKSEIDNLKSQLLHAQAKIQEYEKQEKETNKREVLKTITKRLLETDMDDLDPKVYSEEKADIKYGNVVSINRTSTSKTPLTKVAERVKLRRATDLRREINPNDLVNSELPTAVAEHIVGDILCQCDPSSEKSNGAIEMKRIISKLEHIKSQNLLLELTLNETKASCDRLALLCGKYESNAIALHLALAVSDRTIEAYDVLLALLETEIGLNENIPETFENRMAAESIALQLLKYLDEYKSTDAFFSSWQRHRFQTSNIACDHQWTSEHENRLREHVSRLKAERSNIQGTCVSLESPHMEPVPTKSASTQENRKMDLEMAVLMQELMSLREDRAELIAKLFTLDKEKSAIELKLKYVEGQHKAQSATLKNVQGQLRDTENLLAAATQNREKNYSDLEHTEGVELELMQALAREARLKLRLQELIAILEQVTKNTDARLLEGREMVQDLNQTNSILSETVDRNHRRYQARLKKMEQQLVLMTEQHNLQVKALQSRIAALETPPTNSSENSVNSLNT
ncbi:colorectal mutant cancer protein [Agrilus planipennis]|uniref:Colorectal mutant cancer protein n=1 Tax=Agrilus planipennis TaxID=224129 RepID=A0A1W4X5H8_AGRPL|nr:colorectal mutant cancer protein [Agrilus planipennis]